MEFHRLITACVVLEANSFVALQTGGTAILRQLLRYNRMDSACENIGVLPLVVDGVVVHPTAADEVRETTCENDWTVRAVRTDNDGTRYTASFHRGGSGPMATSMHFEPTPMECSRAGVTLLICFAKKLDANGRLGSADMTQFKLISEYGIIS